MTVNVGLIGLGNIGTGVAEYLLKHGDSLGLHLKAAAVRDPDKPREISVPYIAKDAYEIVYESDVQIVVELVGGEDPALKYVMGAIDRRKSVVTANKAIISKYGKQIFDAARRKGVDVGFEASVAGGIPIVGTLIKDLTANRIYSVKAIVNGTSNYVLTRMGEHMEYDAALRMAQEKGFAEADPYLDVSGEDAKQKLAILASNAWSAWIDPDSIPCEGITDIKPHDFDYAAEVGYAIKLLAIARRHDNKAEVRVNPALIKLSHPLAGIKDQYNAIFLEGDLCGPQMYTGKGAGREPTTSAVLSDIRRIARNIRKGAHDELPALNVHVELVEDPVTAGYIRVNLKHTPKTLERVAGILGDNGINIKNSLQRDKFKFEADGQPVIPDIITTEPISDSAVKKALRELEECDRVHGKPFYLRIED